MRTNRDSRGVRSVLVERREGAGDEQRRADRAEITGRAEGDGVVDIRRSPIGPDSLRAVEWQLLSVHGEEILTEELSQMLEIGAQPPDHRVVAAHRIGRLGSIDDVEGRDQKNDAADGEDQQGCQEIQAGPARIPAASRTSSTLPNALSSTVFVRILAAFTIVRSHKEATIR